MTEVCCAQTVVFPCPLCGGTLSLTETKDGPVALHTLEACAWFKASNARDFERAVLDNAKARETWEAYWRKKSSS